jgi:AcrR family transcriptional regulator
MKLTEPSEAPRRATALPPDERRSMIVRATLPLLLKNGDKITTRQIADAAGIAEGTIFRAFADKDAVIAAVVESALDVGPLERAIAAIDPSQPLDQALEAAIVLMQGRVVDIWRLFASLSTRFHDKSARPPVDLDALVSLLAAHRKQLRVPPNVAARLLRALTLSATHPMLVGEPMAPREIVNLFLHGVSTDSAGGKAARPC